MFLEISHIIYTKFLALSAKVAAIAYMLSRESFGVISRNARIAPSSTCENRSKILCI